MGFGATTSSSRRKVLRVGAWACTRYAVTLLIVITLLFLLPRTVPGDPLEILQGEGPPPSPELRARLMAEHGLDRPLLEQYARYLARLARGDLGRSVSLGPVGPLIADRLPWTLLLLGTAMLVSAAVSFRAGIASAWHGPTRGRRKLLVLMTGLTAVPEYVLAPVVLMIFAGALRLFPAAGGQTPFASYRSPLPAVGDITLHLALPATALTLSLLGAKFLLARASTM